MGITKLALEKLDGIHSSTVSLNREQAIVIFDPQKVEPEDMVRSINESSGFRARVISVGDVQEESPAPNCLFLGFFCDE